MTIPEGWYVLYQPKLRVPSVFDLNPKGVYKIKPSVTAAVGVRFLMNEALTVRLQCLCLLDEPTVKEGATYPFVRKSILVDLKEDFTIDPEALSKNVGDAEIRDAILTAHREWREGYVPLAPDGSVDTPEMKRKLTAALASIQQGYREALMRRNRDWVNSLLPRKVFDFANGLQLWLGDRLYADYQARGGENDPDLLIRNINLFDAVFTSEDLERLLKPDGSQWENIRAPWECWIGFVGAEPEALRIFETMKIVLPEAAKELN